METISSLCKRMFPGQIHILTSIENSPSARLKAIENALDVSIEYSIHTIEDLHKLIFYTDEMIELYLKMLDALRPFCLPFEIPVREESSPALNGGLFQEYLKCEKYLLLLEGFSKSILPLPEAPEVPVVPMVSSKSSCLCQ
jgi:hypothetical protein